jgi:hypothetical protein|tara:strand:+ start:335 stop:520 length:186 start_codon:yes stop_codon:yes gene_type:complete
MKGKKMNIKNILSILFIMIGSVVAFNSINHIGYELGFDEILIYTISLILICSGVILNRMKG